MGNTSIQGQATNALQDVKGVVDTISVVGTVVAALSAFANIFGEIGSVPENHRPPEWEDVNKISRPVAIAVTAQLVKQLSDSQVVAVFQRYVQYACKYIEASQHASPETDSQYVDDLKTKPQTYVDQFVGFETPPDSELCGAIWLHAMWSFGNFGKDEIKAGIAAQQFNAQLAVTLYQAVREVAPDSVIPQQSADPVNPNVPAVPIQAGFGYGMLVVVVLVGVALFFVLGSKRGGK